MNFQSSNPALNNDDAFREFYGKPIDQMAAKPTTCTLQGVVNKTALYVGIALVGGVGGFMLVDAFPGVLLVSNLAAIVLTLGLYFVIARNPARAKYLGPVYAVVEGFFLGAVTGAIERYLAQAGIAVAGGIGSVGLQAFVITISILLAMLGLYTARIIRPTERMKSIVFTAAAGIGICYLLSFVLSFFGITLPFISMGSAFQTGTAGLIGLGVNVLILGVAAFMLIIDFGMVEDAIENGQSKDLEWYLAFALLVTLAWIYYEAVKLVLRLAVLFGDRD